MKSHSRLLTLCVLLLATLALYLGAVPAGSRNALPGKTVRTEESSLTPLRGYGPVRAFGTVSETSKGRVSLVRFSAESEKAARILGSKYLADFTAYGQMEEMRNSPLSPATVLKVKAGGTWVIGLRDKELLVLSSSNDKALQAAAHALDAAQWMPPPRNAYPRYLDCFDNAGLGQWWMPSNKPDEVLHYFKNNPGIVNVHGQPLSASYAPNVYDSTGDDNAVAQAKFMGTTYRLMIWGSLPAWWYSNTVGNGNHVEAPAPGAMSRNLFDEAGYYAYQSASPQANAVHIDAMTQVMSRYKDDPDLIAWLEPHGEFVLKKHPAVVPPGAQKRFLQYLQTTKGYSLAQANAAYGLQAKSWEEFLFPDTAYFYGRRGQYVDLDAGLWRWQPGKDLNQGVEAGWNTPSFNDSAWPEDPRTSARILSQFRRVDHICPLWYRFTAEVPASFLSESGPLYLHILPFTEREGAKLSVWINGKEAQKGTEENTYIYTHVQYDVSSLLQGGKNQFAIYSKGGRIKYRVFLSRLPAEKFPFTDAKLSQFWIDWTDFFIWDKLQTFKLYLAAMRAVDPVRPIKVMTPHLFQTDAMDLMVRYGAYPQLTVEGGWYRPMHYKGYARLRGLPGSSEPGGPVETAAKMQDMFSNIFMESQDCHDYVFDPQDFWPHKEVVQWRTDHAPLLKTLGKTDFGPIRLGVLRDVEQDERYNNDAIWTWDLSRDGLPKAGISPVLIDGPELDRSRADHVPVILDCATTIMTPQRVEALQRYVAAGGTFVAMYNTGRHTPTQRDAWPLGRAFGLRVEERSISDSGHEGPALPLTFSSQQTLFPSLRGKKGACTGLSLVDLGDKAPDAAPGKTVKPIATWEDGSMAICEITYGKGRLIWLGAPFHIRLKDEIGKWMKDSDRQALLVEMLQGLGVPLDTASSDPRVWIEKRESKNGLYTVYMTSASLIRGNDWKLEDQIPTDLTLRGLHGVPVFDMTVAKPAEIPGEETPEGLILKGQIFQPFQVRQFAVVRPDAGLEAPLHWLQVQKNQWRALDIPGKERVDLEFYHREAMKEAAAMGQQGMDLSADWKVRRFDASTPEAKDDWTAPDYADSAWETGKLGTWLVNGWLNARCVQYRKTVSLSPEWTDPQKRLLLGFQGSHLLGVQGHATWTLNGKPMKELLRNSMLIDITEQARQGPLHLALEIKGTSMGCGPGGVLYLKSIPKPQDSLDLGGEWVTLSDWHQTSGTTTLPGLVKGPFALRRSFNLPESWAGKPVRLVIELRYPGEFTGLIVNSTGYARVMSDQSDTWAPHGVRIEQWLKPGSNTIDLYPGGHTDNVDEPNKFLINAQVKSIRLELCE